MLFKLVLSEFLMNKDVCIYIISISPTYSCADAFTYLFAYLHSWLRKYKTGNISETVEDRAKVTINGIGVASYGALGHVPPSLDFQLVSVIGVGTQSTLGQDIFVRKYMHEQEIL